MLAMTSAILLRQRFNVGRMAVRALHGCTRRLLASGLPARISRPSRGAAIMTLDRSLFMFPNDQPVVVLECTKAFEALTQTEKMYAHHLSQASWKGGLIVLLQTSPESPLIFLMLVKLFHSQSMPSLKALALEECEFSEDDFQGLLVYTSGLLTNMGNYKGFGDSKFVPNLPQDKLKNLVEKSTAYKADPELMKYLWKNCGDRIFSLSDKVKQLGFADKGVTTYFTSNCTEDDSTLVNKFLKAKNIEAYNNRLFKCTEGSGTYYEVRLASEISNEADEEKNLIATHEFEGQTFKVTRGDYGPLMGLVNRSLEEAKKYAANETEVKMLEKYVQSFRTGSLEAHKQGSTFWIKDKGPIIETYIGFIETYRDPAGQRGEFEGFVAMVNKEMSAKFTTLVDSAESLLPHLPWPNAFEKDRFLRPDFTSLDVLTFAGSGIPAGINIPNYDEIRQNIGFKNVSLGNVIPASYKESQTPFLSAEDQELLSKYRVASFEVQVGLHELLGHGSGKLFVRNAEGTFNFDAEKLTNPITGDKITSWYEEGETYDSKFLSMGSSYEECRAECVGLYLSLSRDVVKIFGFEGKEADDVIYVNWLSLLLAALKGLEMYQPEGQAWGQAHSQARFVILRVLLEAADNLVTLTEMEGSDGKPDLRLTLDRTKLDTVGKGAIATFLKKLQVYKSTADIKTATAMFRNYSAVLNEGVPFLKYRDIIVARRQPRKMFVQSNTSVAGTEVSLTSYEASHEGLIQSWMERFPSSLDLVATLKPLWESDHGH